MEFRETDLDDLLIERTDEEITGGYLPGQLGMGNRDGCARASTGSCRSWRADGAADGGVTRSLRLAGLELSRGSARRMDE